jgi:hypothetical protein
MAWCFVVVVVVVVRSAGDYEMGVCKCSGWSSGSGSPLLPNLEVVDSVLIPKGEAEDPNTTQSTRHVF